MLELQNVLENLERLRERRDKNLEITEIGSKVNLEMLPRESKFHFSRLFN